MSYATEGRAPRILLIGDNLGDAILLRHGFNAVGKPYELDVLYDGDAALEFICNHGSRSLHSEPCVIIVDLHLPKHGGVAILERLHQAPSLSHTKIVIVATGASPQEEQQLALFRVDLYRHKPKELHEFVRLGEEILDVCLEEPAA